MVKIAGHQIGKPVDHLMSQDQLDKESQRKLAKFMEELEMATFRANQEVMAKKLPTLGIETFVRFSVKVAEARAEYISASLAEVDREGRPDPEHMKRIQALRITYDELSKAYDATERLVERGYSKIG